jgi:hypothetical protein
LFLFSPSWVLIYHHLWQNVTKDSREKKKNHSISSKRSRLSRM